MDVAVVVKGRRCGIKIQDPRLAGGGNLYKTESQCPGPKMWNQDSRLAGGGNLYKTESQCQGPKMWNQDLAGGDNPHEEPEALPGAEDVESRPGMRHPYEESVQ